MPVDCIDPNCTLEFTSTLAMAQHRWAARGIPISETFADVGETLPAEDPTCASRAAIPATTARPARSRVTRTTTTPNPEHPWNRDARAGVMRAKASTANAEKPAEKPENRMGRVMACGLCRKTGHRRETCPEKGSAAAGKAAKKCGGCKRTDGSHAPRCQRDKKAAGKKSAPALPVHSNGTGRASHEVLVVEVGPGGTLTHERFDRATWQRALAVLAALRETA
jgi:hypothetical protein